MTEPVRAECSVCPRRCKLTEGQRGLCRSRMAQGGVVVDENYGRITSLALDPIEKKPLARFRPGSKVLSVGSYGCNLRCPFCQNAAIACAGAHDVSWRPMAPDELAALAKSLVPSGNIGIAYTYNEPLVGFEYVRDCAQEARRRGLANVLVSNGWANASALDAVLPCIDAANIDLKGFTERFYRKLGGSLETVKETLRRIAAEDSCHLEVTTLIIPGENDDPDEMDAMARWIASLDPAIPYHVTRFFPCHRMTDRPATSIAAIEELTAVARRHLRFVYPGNC